MPQVNRRTLSGVLLIVLSLGLITTAVVLAVAGDITTVAGTGSLGSSGDGGPATSAHLHFPKGVALNSSGNLFISDQDNHRIRKVDSSGNITTVVGDGTFGFSGDGGPATSAKLAFPLGLAFDSSGNLFIADGSNHRIRKVDTSGNISTVAGTTKGFSGDGGPATSAQLNDPTDVAVDSSGNLFIADWPNNRIRKVDSSGNISTVAGTGSTGSLEGGFSGDGGPATSAQLRDPWGVTIDSAGNLYIGDSINHRIRKVDTSGTITTVAGTGATGLGQGGFSGDGGPATSPRLSRPLGVAIDSSGNLFIADAHNHRIRKVDTSGVISTVVGSGSAPILGDGGPATDAKLKSPTAVAIDSSGNLFIADAHHSRIRKVEAVAAAAPAPTPVPGISTWGLIGLAALMAGAALVLLRRRPTAHG